ncbi:MAG: polysaccharide biosynthesis/export family protein [Bacteroidetes bacterium]|jgi:polysaccharide export outer membrane protein|nr:polysaccharide biosynthesis/export family protein [Bacteroidota bacterium]
MNFKSPLFLLFALVAVFCSSCSTYEKVPYFQDLNQNNITKEDINNFSPLIIQPGDILAISVTSPSEGANLFAYNLNRISGSSGSTDSTTPENAVIGYMVDLNGNINLPYLGQVKVSGLNTTNLTDQLQASLSNYFKKPVVNVRITNFKISVLGDVAKPDVFTIPNERVTIPEALAMAGDLNITAIRQIFLVREVNGKREYIPIDLNSKKLFDSPYYYMKNHDVLVVTPNRSKISNNNTAGFQRVSLIISALSVVALVLVYRKNL